MADKKRKVTSDKQIRKIQKKVNKLQLLLKDNERLIMKLLKSTV